MASTSLPLLDRVSSLDKTPRLVGKLDASGIASFEADETASNGHSPGAPPRSLKVALDAAALANGHSGATTPDSASEEDYDRLQHDPLTVVAGGKGGGFSHDQDDGTGRIESSKGPETGLHKSRRSRSTPPNLTSIPVTLKKADQKGQYYLIADDTELKEILKMGFERVCSVNTAVSTLPRLTVVGK
jgi:hypothetical protein